MRKRLLVTYEVKDADWWLLNNKFEETVGPMGITFEFFRKRNTNLVGYIADIPSEVVLREILLNTTHISTRLKENGVVLETIEILEAVTGMAEEKDATDFSAVGRIQSHKLQ